MVEGLSISPPIFFVRFLQFPAQRTQYKRSKKIKPFDFLVQQYWGEKKRSRLNISAEFVVNNRICFLSSALSISCHPKISQKATHPPTHPHTKYNPSSRFKSRVFPGVFRAMDTVHFLLLPIRKTGKPKPTTARNAVYCRILALLFPPPCTPSLELV